MILGKLNIWTSYMHMHNDLSLFPWILLFVLTYVFSAWKGRSLYLLKIYQLAGITPSWSVPCHCGPGPTPLQTSQAQNHQRCTQTRYTGKYLEEPNKGFIRRHLHPFKDLLRRVGTRGLMVFCLFLIKFPIN